MNLAPKKNEIFWFFTFYTLMHGGLFLIVMAVFWDDWVLFRTPSNVIFDTFSQAGSMFNMTAYLHVGMLHIGIWLYKVLVFLLFFSSALCLNAILKKHRFLSDENRFFIVLLFMLLPFNFARVALINFPYALCYFFFFLAWSLLDKSRPIALILFFLSFNTNSLLVFYVLPMLDILYRNTGWKNWKTSLHFFYRKSDFIVLPILFFVVKTHFFPPWGLYAGYNETYCLDYLQPSMTAQWNDFLTVKINFIFFLLLFPFSVWFVANRIEEHELLQWRFLALIGIGALAFLLAALPYWIIGKVPTFVEWNSRHQLLLPLGSALILVAFSCLMHRYIKIVILSAFVSLCLSFGFVTYSQFYIDFQKQEYIKSVLDSNTDIQSSNLVVFNDETKGLNAIGRRYRFYEWNGLMELVYGAQDHFGVGVEDLADYQKGKLDQYFSIHYKAALHKRLDVEQAVVVTLRRKDGSSSLPYFPSFSLPDLTVSVSPLK